MLIILFLCAASFTAGFIDSVAGGGGLITLPALLAVNLPPHIALGTNKFQSMFGTSFALFNFTRKGKVLWKIALIGVPFALVGSVIGAKLALIVPASIVAKIIVALIPPIAVLVVFSRRILKIHHETKKTWVHLFILTPIACLVVGTYDGFFGPGTGTFLIIALAFLSHVGLLNATATAKTFNLASNVGAFVTFLLAGCVYFPYALLMAGFNILGNALGSHFAMKHGRDFIQKVLLLSLTILFFYLLWKYF